MTKEERYLGMLQKELREQDGFMTLQPNMSGPAYQVPNWKTVRSLTKGEFAIVLQMVKDGLPITIISSNCGFSFRFNVHVIVRNRAKVVLFFQSDQIPYKTGLNSQAHDDAVFEKMRKYFNSTQNLALLEKYHLEIPQHRSLYEY